MAAAGRAAEVAVFGERLPFSAAEVAALVGGGDGRRGAADVCCRAADVWRQIRCTLRRRAKRPPIAPLTATAPPVGFAARRPLRALHLYGSTQSAEIRSVADFVPGGTPGDVIVDPEAKFFSTC